LALETSSLTDLCVKLMA